MRKELYDNCIKALQAGDYGLGLDFIRHIYREDHEEGRLMAKKLSAMPSRAQFPASAAISRSSAVLRQTA